MRKNKIKHAKNNRAHYLWVSLGIFIVDQVTKYACMEFLATHERISVCPGFDLTLRYNLGAAFSILADASGWQREFFIGLGFIMSLMIYIWLGKLSNKDRLEGFSLACVLGGALGNVCDRLFHGQVTDFLLFYYRHWEWPAFNVADASICIGVLGLLWIAFQKKH